MLGCQPSGPDSISGEGVRDTTSKKSRKARGNKMEKVIYKEKEYEVKYLREAQYGRRGEITVAYIDLQDGHQLIGLAERSPRDPYNEEQARMVSLGRLSKKARKRSK